VDGLPGTKLEHVPGVDVDQRAAQREVYAFLAALTELPDPSPSCA
jgi:hypothetical protein